MMPASCLPRSLLCFVACLGVVLLFSWPLAAEVELTVQLGFEGRLTPGHYAPIQIEVHDYRAFDSSRIRIVQLAGNEWRGEAAIQLELGYAIQSDGRYEAVIPVYDPVNPIVVELVSSTDTVLASTTLDLRGTMRPALFPVLDKQIPRFDDRAAVVDITSLPTQWWAFDSVESLWVASPLPNETWSAVSQWVLAGGSLVLLTGTNFYRMDSPDLRDLLPLSNPVLAVSELETTYLAGSLGDATIGMLSDEGFPLLIQSSHGAGQVSLVTVQAQSLSAESLNNIGQHVSPSQLIALRDSTEQILGAQTLETLNSVFVLLMIALLGLVVGACAVIGRRNRKSGWSSLLVCVIGLSVSSGLASNPTIHAIDLYSVIMRVHIEAGYGLSAVFSSLYSQIDDPFIQRHEEEIIPVQFLPRTLKGMTSYDLSTIPAQTEMRVPFGEARHWYAYGAASSLFDVELESDSSVQISNYHALAFDTAWIIIDGMAYSISRVQRGIHNYSFAPESAVRLGTFFSSGYEQEDMATLLLVHELREAFPLNRGVWLIAVADTEQIATEETTQKVRDITLVVVQGEEVDREI